MSCKLQTSSSTTQTRYLLAWTKLATWNLLGIWRAVLLLGGPVLRNMCEFHVSYSMKSRRQVNLALLLFRYVPHSPKRLDADLCLLVFAFCVVLYIYVFFKSSLGLAQLHDTI
ncbi:unnamed protein product [Dibothriocephalus latus]|uniref:Uncharacterized protein n=1 Tax=Dibothriocephalus latus TaxID=60516 RepID=A0A3P7P7X0_DIBLA|nr:unnamed protein product [Dibothriocephalus latus]